MNKTLTKKKKIKLKKNAPIISIDQNDKTPITVH